jgi:hypothetical protein
MHPLLFANEPSELYLQYSSKKDTSELKLIGLQLIFAFLFRCGKRRIRKKEKKRGVCGNNYRLLLLLP